MDGKLIAAFIALILAIVSFGSYSGLLAPTTGYSVSIGTGTSLVATFITLIIALVMFAKYFKVIS